MADYLGSIALSLMELGKQGYDALQREDDQALLLHQIETTRAAAERERQALARAAEEAGKEAATVSALRSAATGENVMLAVSIGVVAIAGAFFFLRK